MNQNGNGRKWDCISIGMSVGERTFPKDMHEKHGIVGHNSRTHAKLLTVTIEGDVALILYHGGRIAHAFCLTPPPNVSMCLPLLDFILLWSMQVLNLVLNLSYSTSNFSRYLLCII